MPKDKETRNKSSSNSIQYCAKRILNNNNKTLIASDLIKEISKCI